MEGNGNIQGLPKLGFEIESSSEDDSKHVSKYSAILVATIQEAKDRIAQIEYIFCKQLYSNFHFQSKTYMKLHNEKENDLLSQIQKLQIENREFAEENRCLKLEKDRLLSLRERNQLIRLEELENEVREKSKEIEEGMQLQNRLVELVQTKATMVLEKKKQLQERDGRISELLAQVRSLEKEVEVLKGEVKEKAEKATDHKESANGLQKHIDFLLGKLANGEESLAALEKEKKDWQWKKDYLEDKGSKLQKKLGEMLEEVEEGKVLRAKLAQQIDVDKMEMLKKKQELDKSENEKKLLLEKVDYLEKENSELKENMFSSTKVEQEMDLEKFLQQIEAKDSQLAAVKKSHRDLLNKYKSLKSQYNYLCRKFGLTEDKMPYRVKLEYESDSLVHQQKAQTSSGSDFENKHVDPSAAATSEMKKVKIENDVSDSLEDDKVVKSIPASSFRSPTTRHTVPKCPPTAKSAPLVGLKRPASRWIETRSHQRIDGPDPHDDFLDTPLENLRDALNKGPKEKVDALQIPVQKDVQLQHDSSDDETQDMNADSASEEQHMPPPKACQKAFKYVEPVRKKAERENLQGVECKQCKKFYDAVLPDEDKDADGNNQKFRCEHHSGVSRHRYKFIPPMTPEGFWNIGFESEL